MSKPILAIVTQAIRNDIQQPLKYFSKFRIVHFYHDAPYGDMSRSDFDVVDTRKFMSASDLYRKLVDLRPDIVQGTEPYASRKALMFSRVALKVAKKTNAKYFFPMLENRPTESRFGVIAPLMKRILKSFADEADIVFALNSGARRNLQEVGIDDGKIITFLWGVWGVDTKLFSPKEKGTLPLASLGQGDTNKQSPVILYVGRLVEEKGIAEIIEAHKKICVIKKTKLVFIGRGPMEDVIKAYARSSTNVVVLGAKPQKELPNYFRVATLSIYPSVTTQKWEEQIGTVNLQAMACGTPVVSTLSGAIPEYVPNGKAGLLVPEHNPAELAKACLAIINNPDIAKRYGNFGRELSEQKYDTIKNVAKGEKIIAGLLSLS